VIIDSHCHAGKGDGLTGPWDTSASLDRYLARASRAGIDRSVLFPAFNSDYGLANRAVAAIVASNPGRFIGFAMVNARSDAGRVGKLVAEAVERYGFRGIKVHRYDARITREVCEAARAYGLPVLYDVMGEASTVELLATEYADVNFIIPHLGSFADDWRAHVAVIDHLVRHPNVYTDTAGIRRFDFLLAAVRRAGAHKVLFGSDGPWLHPGLELMKVRLLGLSREDEALVLAGNLLRLAGPKRRPARLPAPVPRRETAPAAEVALRDPWAAPQGSAG
jgi:predicted TIM-barrel fold metal-dependent hydrolase